MSKVSVVITVIFIPVAFTFAYKIPEPRFERFNFRGIRVSIPDAPGMQLFAFHANVNDSIEENESGLIMGEVIRSTNDRWIFEDKKITLGENDVLHYWIYAQVDGLPYTKVGVKPISTNKTRQKEEDPDCRESITVVRGKMAECRDRLIFEETFDKNFDTQDSTTISNSSWKREIMFPLDPDYEFCAYRELPKSLQFENGTVGIVPLILDEIHGENATLFGRLDLAESCTGSLPLECHRRAVGHSILPPVISARLTTKQSFYFRYGKIEIRAKFPRGDWLYPELWLQPKRSSYGMGYLSGRIFLGMARGNENLINISNSATIRYDSGILEFGLRTGPKENIRENKVTLKKSLGIWNDDFHVYTTVWNEQGFEFQVDGKHVGQIESGEWRNSDPSKINLTRSRNMSPYDDEFYIVAGLGVGGIRVFPDFTTSTRYPKPWRNIEAKAMLHFWQAKEQWLPTWSTGNGVKDSSLQIDYIRVWTV